MKAKTDNSDIYTHIYEIVRLIPKGRVTSYGAIAAAVGMQSGARMVGYAMMHCEEVKPKVPAHRVVNSSGLLTGRHHFKPPERMEQLLAKDGVQVKGDKVVNFKAVFWDPLQEVDM